MGLTKFPSPHGDKFQQIVSIILNTSSGFRPLTGINFNPIGDEYGYYARRFRPLTGINFNDLKKSSPKIMTASFRPLTGINFNVPVCMRRLLLIYHFRPLTGIYFNDVYEFPEFIITTFPSPHGDKFQLDSDESFFD